jgi:hypothetical protein
MLLPVLAGCVLAACGADDNATGPPGSASNPLVASTDPSPAGVPPAAKDGVTAGTRRGTSPSRRSSTTTQRGRPAAHATAEPRSAAAATRATTARRQKAPTVSASRPCSLVTKAQARAILGAPILEPVQAPLGPTCIYQAKSGSPYVTLALQTVDFTQLRRQIGTTRAVSIADRTAYCGTLGKPMLVLPLAGRRVLSIAASCALARRFAAKAAPHL